ncbi:protein phosphatase 3 regulatory subunit b alpha isoform type 1 [Anaeramoeba flamelloides]|uniref:Protein phosphatase 3 regulatory subunit b alpha isoform type n=1 Tax=Anaeramoeba flamelloides TaxID=1746091 RepID=A0AAV7ZEP0_9EUKA|nr:protein phosphatase 3 regulatory subunit b alpha isoform type [Anaeramoeba flamelloides]KAJ6231905.1 protein phosphatase 3 regulatory subunit b alpha isoform type 1 [Anaeramoeba flamelloides]
MGLEYSKELTEEQVNEFSKSSGFTKTQITKLYEKFMILNTQKNGRVSYQEFLNIPELASNPILERVISIIDKNNNQFIEFSELIHTLSIFVVEEKKKERIDFVFKIYDLNGDGFISNGDLFLVLKSMAGDNLKDIQLQQIVDKTIAKFDKDEDGKLSYDEFINLTKDFKLDELLYYELEI